MLLNGIFNFAKEIIAFNLTESEMALLCAEVLINPSKCVI